MKARWTKVGWLALAGLVALQTYYVRELLAALALVTVVFAGFAAVVFAIKGMHWVFDQTVARAESLAQSEFSRRPFRRLRSLTVR